MKKLSDLFKNLPVTIIYTIHENQITKHLIDKIGRNNFFKKYLPFIKDIPDIDSSIQIYQHNNKISINYVIPYGGDIQTVETVQSISLKEAKILSKYYE